MNRFTEDPTMEVAVQMTTAWIQDDTTLARDLYSQWITDTPPEALHSIVPRFMEIVDALLKASSAASGAPVEGLWEAFCNDLNREE
jgi:hypothetical protein